MILVIFFFFFNDTATTEIYTLSLHDALPISLVLAVDRAVRPDRGPRADDGRGPLARPIDRKSTRLNSSHGYISYAVFCLKKKNKKQYSNLSVIVLSNPHFIFPATRHTFYQQI